MKNVYEFMLVLYLLQSIMDVFTFGIWEFDKILPGYQVLLFLSCH